jgi:hypothetical protein
MRICAKRSRTEHRDAGPGNPQATHHISQVLVQVSGRSVGLSSVKGQFPRVLAGGAPLTGFSFSYKAPALADPSEDPLKLEFEVTPDATPPTNIHVIIGRNGVGKT